jgi:hypothetical protein
MTRVAEDRGLGRERLYKALRPGAKPGFATIGKLLGALGVRFQIAPKKACAQGGRAYGRAGACRCEAEGPRGTMGLI